MKFTPARSWSVSPKGWGEFWSEAEPKCDEFRQHNPFNWEGDKIGKSKFEALAELWVEGRDLGKLFLDQDIFVAKNKDGSRWITARRKKEVEAEA